MAVRASRVSQAACVVVHNRMCEEAICHLALQSTETQRLKGSLLEKNRSQ